VRLAREPVDLGALAAATVGHLEDLAADKEQAVRLEGTGPVEVTGDWLVLRQAAITVLDNAIKYSPEGTSIRVAVGGSADRAWITFADQGPGIPAEERDRIFERFYRVDKARSREQGGAGLGLSLVRWGVEAHGGRIEVASEPGMGSTFTIVLPVRGTSASVDKPREAQT
jgi:signal transduction histidine kinase